MIEIYPSILPGAPIDAFEADGLTLQQWLDERAPRYLQKLHLPVSAKVNGFLVPPEEWGTTWLTERSHVELRPQPQDPGTMLIAALVAGAVAVAAALLLKPSIPNQNTKSTRGSSIYEANAQGNRPKLGDVIPEIAGRHKTYPDIISAPRRYFVDQKTQALDMLLCIGRGEFTIPDAEIRIGSTPLRALGSDVNYTIFPPGADVTGHRAHANWYNAPEVGASVGASGLRLKDGQDLTQSLSASALTFSGSDITVPNGAGTAPADWEVGHLLEVGVLQDIEVIDGGQDANDVYLRDTLEGEFAPFAPGDAITISGGTAIGGDYLVHSFTGGTPDQMTLNSTDSVPEAFLPPGAYFAAIDFTGVRYRIEGIVTEDYEVQVQKTTTDADGNTTTTTVTETRTRRIGFNVTRLTPDGTEDTGWGGFASQTTSDAFVRLDTSGIEGGWSGSFLACPEGELTSRIEWDIFGPSGLGYIEDDGDIAQRTRQVELQYRHYGTTEWFSDKRTVSGRTRDQLGWTFATDFDTPITPQVRVRRIGSESNSTQALDRLEWYGLRAKLPHKTRYEGVTVLALTLSGSDTIASQTENQISVVATRRLPVRVGGQWQPAQAVRGIAPWVAYVAKDVGYTDDEIDYDELDRLDAVWEGRGDFYDFVQDTDSTVESCINRALRAGFAELTFDAGKLRPVRDEPRSTFEHMYTPQNLTEPLRINVQAPRPDDPDGVDVEYFSSETWTTETVECRMPGDQGFKSEKLRVEGVTDRTRAWRIGMRARREMRYRRKRYVSSTEMDALNSRRLSYCGLADDLPGRSQSAWLKDIADLGEGTAKLICSEPFAWSDTKPNIVSWRRPDGTLDGPYDAQRGDSDYEVIVVPAGTWPDPFQRMEPPHVLFGEPYPVLITDINPEGIARVGIEAVNYDERVYADDNNAPS